MFEKNWWKSKTVWYNVVLTLAGVLTLIADVLTATPQLTAPGCAMLGVGILNIINRIWFTNTAIAQGVRSKSVK